MSKTKEEILQHHYIHGKGLNHPEYVQNAMDEYAAQVLSEYKEKLKGEITSLIDQIPCSMSDFKKGELAGLETTIQLL